MDAECPYLAEDGTCLLPDLDLTERCVVRERIGHEEKDDWILQIKWAESV